MSGRVVRQALAGGHHCRPPNARQMFGGRDWVLDSVCTHDWSVGDIWECDCGQQWKVRDHAFAVWEKFGNPEPKPVKVQANSEWLDTIAGGNSQPLEVGPERWPDAPVRRPTFLQRLRGRQ